jgi:hypothetical protein
MTSVKSGYLSKLPDALLQEESYHWRLVLMGKRVALQKQEVSPKGCPNDRKIYNLGEYPIPWRDDYKK